MRMMVSGVLNGSKGALYYPPEEVDRSGLSGDWNGMPLTVRHPTINGQYVTARSPGVLDRFGIGYVFNTRAGGGVMDAEAWFDVDLTRKADAGLPAANRILPRVERGLPIELSTGLFTKDTPVRNGRDRRTGKPFDFVATHYRPDHLAVLPDAVGACSLRDGCGVLVGNQQGRDKLGRFTGAEKADVEAEGWTDHGDGTYSHPDVGGRHTAHTVEKIRKGRGVRPPVMKGRVGGPPAANRGQVMDPITAMAVNQQDRDAKGRFAASASAKADQSDDPDDHDVASEAHYAAGQEKLRAASELSAAGPSGDVDRLREEGDGHYTKGKEHREKALKKRKVSGGGLGYIPGSSAGAGPPPRPPIVNTNTDPITAMAVNQQGRDKAGRFAKSQAAADASTKADKDGTAEAHGAAAKAHFDAADASGDDPEAQAGHIRRAADHETKAIKAFKAKKPTIQGHA